MIFLFNWMIFRFQPLIFKGVEHLVVGELLCPFSLEVLGHHFYNVVYGFHHR